MKIDYTSFFVNSTIACQKGGQAGWATSLGQEKTKGYPIQIDKPGMADILAGMVYNAISDMSGVSFDGMTQNREIILFSSFSKVFINGRLLEGSGYNLAIVREHTKTADGRLHLSYAPYFSYSKSDERGNVTRIMNANTVMNISSFLGCKNGCWFVRKIEIRNQKELHLRVVVVNPSRNAVYNSHKERSYDWEHLAANDIALDSTELF